MSLSQLINYYTFDLPHDLTNIKELDFIQDKLRDFTLQRTGMSFIIPQTDKPLWYYFLVYKVLYSEVPEIILDIGDDNYLLLHTIYKYKKYVRPQSIFEFKDIIMPPKQYPSRMKREVLFDLSKLPKVFSAEDIKTVVEYIKKKRVYTHKLIFEKETDTISGLIVLAMYYGYAKQIEYHVNSTIISL